MRVHIIHPRGGLLKSGGGLLRPGGGFVRGGRAGPTGPALLADFDFSAPLTSWTTGRTGFSSAFATDEWLMQDAASPHANNVGSATLANTSGLVNQGCPVIHDGTGYNNRRCWEARATNNVLTASSSAAGNSDGTDLCARFVISSVSLGSSVYVAFKGTFATPGWRIYTSASGRLIASLYDGATASPQLAGASGLRMDDGAPHAVELFYDVSAAMLYLRIDGVETSVATGALGSISGADALMLNGRNTLGTGSPSLKVHYAGVCVGANAQAMYDEEFWQHGQDPTGLLTTTSRNSTISVPVGPGLVGHFAGGTTLGTTQLPIGYHAGFSEGLGLYCNSAVTNLVPRSRLSTGATSSNVTATDNAADAADGFRAATTIAATADNGYLAKTCVTVASTAYCGSVYIKQSTAGVTGRVIAYDETNGAELAATTYTATGAWQDVQVPFSTIGGGISTSLRVEVDTSGETVIADLWQVNLGGARDAIINTSGAAAATVLSQYKAAATAGVLAKAATGEIEAVYVSAYPASPNTDGYIVEIGEATGNVNRRILWATAKSTTPGSLGYSDAGSNVWNLSSGVQDTDGQENISILRWDGSGGLSVGGGADAQLLYNGGGSVVDVGTFSSTESITDVSIGNIRTAAAGNPDAYIQRARIWDGERA